MERAGRATWTALPRGWRRESRETNEFNLLLFLKHLEMSPRRGGARHDKLRFAERSGYRSAQIIGTRRHVSLHFYSSASDFPSRPATWSIVHCLGALSFRQRRIFVPCRNR